MADLTPRQEWLELWLCQSRRPLIVFDERTFEHLDVIESKYDSLIRNEIESQLTHEPNCQTRNRKPMTEPTEFGATWELRVDPAIGFGSIAT